MIKGDGSNESVDGGERESSRAAETENCSCFAVCGEPERFEQIPLRKVTLDLADVTPEALQDLGNYDARKSNGFCIGNHPAQLGTSATRGGAEEVDPNRGIDQNQTRFLRAAL